MVGSVVAQGEPDLAGVAQPSPSVHFEVLGHPRVLGPTGIGSTSTLGGSQGARALVYLWWERGRPVPRHELATVLWGDDLPASWSGALRSVVSRVRAALRLAGADAESVRSLAGCYVMDLDESSTADVTDARAAFDLARERLGSGDAETAYTEARRGNDIVASELLPGDESPWVVRVRAELEEERVTGTELLATVAIRTGRAGEVIRLLERPLARHPLRETLHRLVMEAHVAAGNRAAALRAYETCRRSLVDELGVNPGPEIQELYQRLLHDDDQPQAVMKLAVAEAGTPVAAVESDLLRRAFEASGLAMGFASPDRSVGVVNAALERMVDRDAAEIAAIGIDGLTHPEDRLRHADEHSRLLRGEIDRYRVQKRFIHRDGHLVHCMAEVVAVRSPGGSVEHLFGTFWDITDQVSEREQLAWMAFNDPLTGLPNRASFVRTLESVLGPERGSDRTLLVLALHGLAEVNVAYGRSVGDVVVGDAATRLINGIVDNSAVVARVAPDDLVALLPAGVEPAPLVESLRQPLAAPFWFGGRQLAVGLSVDVVPTLGGSPNQVLQRVEQASREARGRLGRAGRTG